ncbi:SusC/RagA family TonB-linked outer membrane protein [Flavilitoribacter nigricans]|uniref:SusC/RagA family TonB-linked outer membrane protein n=1 Tax=Flavilitoribacter nigricans (strain ATCC 23147 / DSM 23189 / NBRC 102662 / NCIMB 1420 / SS-2) TaxID=1122177 RepID=A0A2D0N2L2_FLAN2|nr:TonB-dependent receptor [Flavilitoribacter nigricans]PHN02761.1 SusC/RagA family TonB-linked outer membrane protein [Flavilitoribacter nigricans DSM 23189 = NBRC 102662]
MTRHRTHLQQILWLFFGLCVTTGLFGQQRISGLVTDTDRNPLIGVNIMEAGTNNGTVTDFDGTYELTVGENASLTFSYTGYQSQTVETQGRSSIDLQLSEGALLDEVVVVGYGREKKSTLTGAVASIDNKQLTSVPVANSANLLAGRVPGVMTRQNSGLPGSENTQIRIRGYAGAPLVLVDGIQASFDRIDPNDIESITVLKDAAAAVYGARAGNGVILVTTKRGREGPARITYNGSYTSMSASRLFQQVNTTQYVELVRESDLLDGAGLDATFSEEDLQKFANKERGYEGGDWINGLIKNNAPMHQHNLSVSGGNEDVKYFTSFGYMDQESYFRSRDYDYGRYNARSNIDARINDNLSFNLDLSYRFEKTERPSNNIDALMVELATTRPTFPTSLPDPSIGEAFSGFSQRNPISTSKRSNAGFWDRDEDVIQGRLGINYDLPFVTGLSAKAEVGLTRYNRAIKSFAKPTDLYEYQPETETYLYQATQRGVSSISESQFRRTQFYPLLSLTFDRTFGDHDIKALALYEQITRKFSNFSAGRLDLLSFAIPELFIGSQNNQTNNGFSGSDIGRKSYVGRLNYSFKDKYLFEATFRADGNVLFSPQTRWGYFPSLSAGWVISEDLNLGTGSTVDFLKLRASYSQLGDDTANGLTGFDYLTGFELQDPFILGDGVAQPTIRTRGLVNPLLTWEEMTVYNIGLETRLWNGKLSLETELFYRKREGIIAQNIEDVPSTFGANLPVVNINSQDNRGIEISAVYQERIGDFRIELAPNFSLARSKWLEVKSQEAFEDPDQKRLFELDGKNVNRFVGYVADGIFMSQQEIDNHPVIQDDNENLTLRPGDIRYKDLDGDGIITFRDQDVIAFATGIPEMVFGMNIGMSYKNFRLSALLQGASRFAINISGAARTMFSNQSIPLTYHYDLRWQPDPNNPSVNINPDAALPAASQSPSFNNNRNSDFWVKDVTYFRLKNLNLSYSLPNTVLGNSGIKQAEVYVAGENLLLLTNLGIYDRSFDPEFQPGSPTNRLPITRSVAFGLRISL